MTITTVSLVYPLFFILGSVFGSFAHVFVYGRSILRKRSSCDQCLKELSILDNIPVLSYLKLKGKCKYCDERIPVSTLLYEIVCGLFFLVLYSSFGVSWSLLSGLVLFCILFLLGEIDRREGLVPELISIPGTGLVFLLSFTTIGWRESLLGILLGAIFFQVQHLMTGGKGIGLGDMRVGSLMGAYFGGHVIIPLILLGYIFASIRALFGLYISGNFTMKTELRLVPFLALSAFIFLFFGDILLIDLIGSSMYGYFSI